jgi:transcriptional regulator with XRE-family HTH domain
MNIGDRLKRARLSAGYAQQKDVAEALGIERTRYLKWEHGDSQPSLDMLAKMCRLFGVSSDYLLGLEDENSAGLRMSIKEITGLRRVLAALEDFANDKEK